MAPVLNKIAGHPRRGRGQMPARVAGTGPWRSVFALLLLTLGLGLWVKVVSAGLPGSLSLPEYGSEVTAPGDPKGNAGNAPAFEMNAPLSTGVDYSAARPASVLYDQFMGASINSASSQNFEPRLDAYDDQLADDFIVPAGETWIVDQVEIAGAYSGSGPAASVNVFFYTNANDLPATPVFTQTDIVYSPGPGNYGDLIVPLDPPATLSGGTYWLSVQANQNYSPAGQWFWRMRVLRSDREAAWRNPGGAFGRTNCVSNWGARRSTCFIGGFEGDQMFRLSGISNATPTLTVTGTPPTMTRTRTPTPIPPTATGTQMLPSPVLTQPPQITPPTETPTDTPIPACGLTWRIVASPNTEIQSFLNSVAVISTNNAWSVGAAQLFDGSYQTLIQHWDGANWNIVPSPNANGHGYLNSVAALSPGDVWAAGGDQDADGYQPLVAHWNGTAWTLVPVLAFGAVSNLKGVTAVAADDVWAVGYYQEIGGPRQTLTIHWNGTQWSRVPSPNLGTGNNVLESVSASSATDVWAVGSEENGAPLQPLALHWDGTQWNSTFNPFPMRYDYMKGVTASSSGNVWAVGARYVASVWLPEVWRWTGSAWGWVCCSNPVPDGFFDSVTATSANDVWAAGHTVYPNRTLVVHWNGTEWSHAASRNIGPSSNELKSVAASSPTDVWAVGSYYNYGMSLFWTLAQRYSDPCATPPPTATSTTPTASRTATATATGTSTATGTFTRTPIPLTATPSPASTSTPTGAPAATRTPSATPSPCPITFRDVQQSDYFYEPVRYLYCRGVISGYADGTFRPFNNTTRGQLAKIVVLAEGWNIYTPPTPTFSDVPSTHAFYPYVETAYSHNIISGYDCGTGCLEFRPGNNATRGQICKIVYIAVTAP